MMFKTSNLAANVHALTNALKNGLSISNSVVAGGELSVLQRRLASSTPQVGAKTTSDAKKEPAIQLTEEMPPIPPNLGWSGDENVDALYKMHDIRRSFKYGNPPIMRQRPLYGPLVMRLLPVGHCKNRPFYRIAVQRNRAALKDKFFEDLGSIDPLPNRDNQIIVGLNIERIKHYLSQPILLKGQVGIILGLAGLLPTHPKSFVKSYKLREKVKSDQAKKEAEAAAAAAKAAEDLAKAKSEAAESKEPAQAAQSS